MLGQLLDRLIRMNGETNEMVVKQRREGSFKMILWSLFLVLIVCALIWYSFTRKSFSGSVTASGQTLGDWTMYANQCSVKQFGAPQPNESPTVFTLSDSGQPRLSMAVSSQQSDPPYIEVTSTADGRVYLLDFDRCAIESVSTDVPTASGRLNGSVAVNCMIGLSRLQGKFDFQNCK